MRFGVILQPNNAHTETYIYRLRKKIRVSFAGDELIVTKKGGYQLLPEKAF